LLLSFWSEFGPRRQRRDNNSLVDARQGKKSFHGTQAIPVAEILASTSSPTDVPMAIPVVEVPVGQTARPATAQPVATPSPTPPQVPLPPGVRRFGSASHLRQLSPLEGLLVLLSQLSALMDSKDTQDWTINPAYHPEVNAFIQKHANNAPFVARARALQKNRAPYYGKTVVAGPRRQTILAVGRQTALGPTPPRR
jgi:hypothetical protein